MLYKTQIDWVVNNRGFCGNTMVIHGNVQKRSQGMGVAIVYYD